jgi:hypothetical protein
MQLASAGRPHTAVRSSCERPKGRSRGATRRKGRTGPQHWHDWRGQLHFSGSFRISICYVLVLQVIFYTSIDRSAMLAFALIQICFSKYDRSNMKYTENRTLSLLLIYSNSRWPLICIIEYSKIIPSSD